MHSKPKYINPFVDFGFKYLFGREESKPFLMDLLNVILSGDPGFSPIVKLDYLDKEMSRRDRNVRGVIYDIHCETSDGKRFNVEMQNQPQGYFFDRIIYYASKGIVDQGKRGKGWKYEFLPVYCVSFMNFIMDGYEDRLRIDAALCDLKTGQLFSDKQRYIFIQTPLFDKKSDRECVTEFDQWMYNLINMPTMDTMAFIDQKKLFDQFDKMASYATLSEADRIAYDADLKAYRDLRGQLEYAEEKGRREGEAKMIREMARQGISLDMISQIAKMTVDKIKRIISTGNDA